MTHLLLCGCEVATYVVIGEPPIEVGVTQVTLAFPRPEAACTERGAEGRDALLVAPFAGIATATVSAMRTEQTIAGCFQSF